MTKLKKIYCLHTFIKRYVFLLYLLCWAYAGRSQNEVTLYVSAQTKQASTFSGSYSMHTDSFSYGHIVLSSKGPLTFSTDHNDLSADRNQDFSWGGKVSVNLNEIPTPGTTEPAAIYGNYNIGYSRPYGSGDDEGTVVSTYYCNGQNCPDHHGTPGIHEIVKDSGIHAVRFNIVSIMASLPDTIIVDNTQKTTLTVTCYPAQGGSFHWSTNDPSVQIANADQQTVNIKLNSLADTYPVINASFQIAGVSYTAHTVLKTGTPSCTHYNSLIVIDRLSINMNDDRHKSMTPMNPGNCTYTVQAPAFSLNMKGIITRQLSVNTGNTTLKFTKGSQDNYTNLDLEWSGNVPITGMRSGNNENGIQLTATQAHITSEDGKQLKGTVTIHAILNSLDVYGNGSLMVRKTEGDIVYDLATGYDFSGLKNVATDLVKKGAGNGDVIIGTYNASVNKDGILTSMMTATGNPYISNGFAVAIKAMKQEFTLDIPHNMPTLGKASGDLTVSGIQQTQGSMDFHFDFNNNGNGNIIQSTATDLTAFGMKLSDVNIKADLSPTFDLNSIAGKATAKNEKFDAPLPVSYFRADNGILSTFNISGKVDYNGFTFYIVRSAYLQNEGTLSLTANMLLNLDEAGKNEIVGVNKFTIDGAGKVNLGGIQGSIDHIPAAIDFTANAGNHMFSGDFTGNFGNMPVSGAIEIHPKDNYDYAVLTVKPSNKIPLGASGLSMTDVSGAIGLNYDVKPSLAGTPKQGSYEFALKTKLQDEAGMLNAEGNSVIPFDPDPSIELLGTITTVPGNAFFTSNVGIDFHLNRQSVEGRTLTSISFPHSNKFLDADKMDIHFTVGDNKWTVSGSNVNGRIFNNSFQLNNSSIDMYGAMQQPNKMFGDLKGVATGEYRYVVNFPVNNGQTPGTVSGVVLFKLNAPINAPINQDGLANPIAATLFGNDTLTLDMPNLGFHETYLSATSASGQFASNNGAVSFSGTMEIVLGSARYTKPLNISF